MGDTASKETVTIDIGKMLTDGLLRCSLGDAVHPSILAANGRRTSDGKGIEIYTSSTLRRRLGREHNFIVKTIHLSRQSDAYLGPGHKYGGIIIYARNDESDWRTWNGTHCKSGYVVIKDTDCSPTPQEKFPREPGKVHGAIYRVAFGESCREKNVIGEGFGIDENGIFTPNSVLFNASHDNYHDKDKRMCKDMQICLNKVVKYWEVARRGFTAKQNFNVEDLL